MSNLTTPRTMTLKHATREDVKRLKEVVQQNIGLLHIKITELADDDSVMIENYTDNDLFHLGYFAAAKTFGKL
jgi:hypothetical protein